MNLLSSREKQNKIKPWGSSHLYPSFFPRKCNQKTTSTNLWSDERLVVIHSTPIRRLEKKKRLTGRYLASFFMMARELPRQPARCWISSNSIQSENKRLSPKFKEILFQTKTWAMTHPISQSMSLRWLDKTSACSFPGNGISRTRIISFEYLSLRSHKLLILIPYQVTLESLHQHIN